MTAPTKLQRHLDLIAYLVGRRLPVSADELLEKIPAYAGGQNRESVKRMFERDKDDLRAAGIPIKTLMYTLEGQEAEGYVIERRDFYLPYLKLISAKSTPATNAFRERARVAEVQLKEPDASLALEALRRVMGVPGFPLQREAKSAFRKLAFDLDPDAFSKDSPVLVVDAVRSGQLATSLKTLSDALLAKKRVSFDYRGMYRGQDTKREVHGYALLFQSGHWYLIGQDLTRDDIRVFRVGRMSAVTANTKKPGTPDYAVPADFSVDAYVGRQAWELGEDEEPVQAVVRFRFPLSLWAARNNYGALIDKNADGSETRAFTVRQVTPFARWVLSLQNDAEVVEPEQLRKEVRDLARKVAAAHGGEG